MTREPRHCINRTIGPQGVVIDPREIMGAYVDRRDPEIRPCPFGECDSQVFREMRETEIALTPGG